MTMPGDQPNRSTPMSVGVSLRDVTVGGDLAIRDVHIGDNYILPAGRPPLWIDVPSMPPNFVGRDAIVAELAARLTAGGSASAALSADGKPGVGKTTLAVALAHHKDVLAHFTDGVLWAGLGTQPDLPSRLARWADALGVDVSNLPDTPARAQAVRDAIGHKKLLLVIDDAWTIEAAQTLRCGGPHCAHLLTSRSQQIAAAFAGHSDRVKELSPDHALDLLRRLAPKAVDTDEDQATRLLAAVGYLPLAVELLGSYLAAGGSGRFAAQSRRALAELSDPARRLALASRRLGDGSGQIVSLQATIALSIDGLAELSTKAVAAFYSLGSLAPKPASFDLAAAQAVAQCAADTVTLLIDRNLLEYDADDESLALHQTIAEVARAGTPAEAITCQREHYLGRVNADRADWQAIEAIYPQLQWAWQQRPPTDTMIVEFVDILSTYQTRRGRWDDRLAWLTVALAAAEQSDIPSAQALMLNDFAIVYSALGEKQEALSHLLQALPLYHRVKDHSGEATMLNNIGSIYYDLGENQKALGYFEQSLPLRRKVGDLNGEAISLNNIGGVYATLGKKHKALGYHEQALSLFHQVGDLSGVAGALNNVGGVYDDLGEKHKALGAFEQALPLFRQIGDLSREAMTLSNIGLVYADLGKNHNALDHYDRALSLFRQMSDPSGEATMLNNIGSVYYNLGEIPKALGYFEQALPMRHQVGDLSGEATTLNHIGMIYSALGEEQKSLGYFEQSLLLTRQVGDPSGEAATLNNIGSVYKQMGELPKALGCYKQALHLRRQVKDRRGEATTLNNIGVAYSALGEEQKSLGYYRRALHIQRQVSDPRGEANTLSNIGSVYRQMGELPKALGYFEQSLLLRRQVGDLFGENNTRYNMAMVFKNLGRLAEAEQQLQIVVQIDEAVGHPDLASDRQALEKVRAMLR